MASFPVRFLAEFFANHGMLGFRDRPRWATVAGGSARYVEALTAPFRERLRLNAPVRSIRRTAAHVEVTAAGSGPEVYDHVVIAAHSDQALAMLADASERERELLGAIPYQRNEAVLHTDSRLLPRRRSARAAWNFHLLREPKPLRTVTYYMNHLQRLAADRDFCVTLNRTEAIDPEKVIRTISYSDPVYTPRGVAAQRQHGAIGGMQARTHYCGAYWGRGFHEDGVDLEELPALFDGRWLWSARRPAAAWFRRADHLGDPQRPLAESVRELVLERTGVRADGPVRLLTNLRYLGHCFKPVSFYYCFEEGGERLLATVAEVTNTPWGERHAYVLAVEAEADHGTAALAAGSMSKELHVSPLMGMDLVYDWSMTRPAERLAVHIESDRADGESVFDATLALQRREMSAAELRRALVRYPLLTVRILARIYASALRLRLRGAPYFPHPRKGAVSA
jgi:DUF1365 family protein